MKQSLHEINRIASANTSRALNKLFKQDVELKIPRARVVENVKKLKPFLDPEEMIVGIYLPIGGDAKGAALLVIPIESALALSDRLLKRKKGSTRKLTRLDKAALKEVGNIICGQYFTVFSNMLGIKIIEHIPRFSYSMFGSIFSDVLARVSRITEDALIIEVNINYRAEVLKKVYFLLFFEPMKITRLLK